MTKTVMITGSNRGLGLEFVKQFANEGYQVISATRNSESGDLVKFQAKHPNLDIIQLDLSDLSSCRKTLAQMSQPIDILINNAGIWGGDNQDSIEEISEDNLCHAFNINAVAPLMVTQMLLKNLRLGKDKIIANITSRMGSISDNESGKRYAYRASKSALNALMRSLHHELLPEGFKVLLLHPGWVATDMGGDNALVKPPESISNMRKLIANAHDLPEQFYHMDGNVLPW